MRESVHTEFMRLYEPLHERFIRYCSNHAYGIMDTEDLVQETILATLQRFHTIKDQEKLLSYMISVANNTIRDLLRRKKFTGEYNEKAFRRLESRSTSPETAMDIHHLHLALQSLPVRDKEAILMFEINGFSIEEIAAVQQSGISATKTRLSRAREKLRVLMGDEHTEEAKKKSVKLFTLL